MAKEESLKEAEVTNEKKKEIGLMHKFNIKRIAIGRTVISDACFFSIQPGGDSQYIQINYTKKGDFEKKVHKITVDKDIKVMKYHIMPTDKSEEMESRNDDSIEDEKKEPVGTSQKSARSQKDKCPRVDNFLAFHIHPNKENQLGQLPNSYQPDGENDLKRFFTIEFHNSNDLKTLLDLMKNIGLFNAMIMSGQIPSDEKHKYILPFTKEDKKQAKAIRTRCSYLRSVGWDEVVLQFPFEATYTELDDAAQGLTEANGLLSEDEEQRHEADNINMNENFQNVWKHSHIVRGEDYERLKPGEWLNDTLIDLWMTW